MTKHTVTITNRDNKKYEVDNRRPLLDALREQGVDLPYGCKYGGCITCAAKLTSDEIKQRVQEAAEMLDLVDHLDKRPRELSGGGVSFLLIDTLN